MTQKSESTTEVDPIRIRIGVPMPAPQLPGSSQLDAQPYADGSSTLPAPRGEEQSLSEFDGSAIPHFLEPMQVIPAGGNGPGQFRKMEDQPSASFRGATEVAAGVPTVPTPTSEQEGVASKGAKRKARQFHNWKPLVFGALWACFNAVLAVASIGALVALVVTRDTQFGLIFLGAGIGYVVMRFLRFMMVRKVTCSLCHGPVIHSKRCTKHKLARRFGPLTYHMTVVMGVLLRWGFTCMYCGTPYRLRK